MKILPKNYELIQFIGGQRSGEFITIKKNKTFWRIPTFKTVVEILISDDFE